MTKPMRLDNRNLREVVEAAKAALAHAYCPYSNYPVGAAVLAEDGRIFPGANIENASYSVSLCAERAALFSAVSAGCQEFLALAVYTPTERSTKPCGVCRQAFAEFSKDLTIVLACESDELVTTSLAKLLPDSFRLGRPRNKCDGH